jgi:glutathione S-transferase
VRGSWDIATYANEATGSHHLGDMEAIAPWDSLSERALAEGRTRVVRAVLNNKAALEEALPAFVPPLIRPSMRFLASDAARRLDKKYAHLYRPGSIHNALLATRGALKESGNDYILGEFSYADITMAVVVEVIAPVARTEPPLGPETQACWNDAELAREFSDLVEWRNRLAENGETSYSQFQPA